MSDYGIVDKCQDQYGRRDEHDLEDWNSAEIPGAKAFLASTALVEHSVFGNFITPDKFLEQREVRRGRFPG